ncbi:MAG TPA: hypothetical protein VF746_27445 [Longimicrobium sp.]|jgi:hypothetical protein
MSRMKLALALVAPALLLAPLPALAQERPEQAAERYFEAMKGGDWTGAAAMMHPSALQAFKQLLHGVGAMQRGDVMLDSLFGLRSADLPALSDAQVYARVIERLMSRDPETRQIMSKARYHGLRHAMVGDTAHVDYEMGLTVQGTPITVPARISLMRDGGQWKALLSRDTEQMLRDLERALGTPAAPARP